MKGHDHDVSCVEFMPDGGHLVSCSRDKTIRMWDINTGFCIRTLNVNEEGHSSWIKVVCVNSKGTFLASGSEDENVVVWDLTVNPKQNAIANILTEHTNRIDTVVFANNEACKIIESADYNSIAKGGIIDPTAENEAPETTVPATMEEKKVSDVRARVALKRSKNK